MLRVLVGCEESGTVRDAFAALAHATCPHVFTGKDGTSHCTLAASETALAEKDAELQTATNGYKSLLIEKDAEIAEHKAEALKYAKLAGEHRSEITRLKRVVEAAEITVQWMKANRYELQAGQLVQALAATNGGTDEK